MRGFSAVVGNTGAHFICVRVKAIGSFTSSSLFHRFGHVKLSVVGELVGGEEGAGVLVGSAVGRWLIEGMWVMVGAGETVGPGTAGPTAEALASSVGGCDGAAARSAVGAMLTVGPGEGRAVGRGVGTGSGTCVGALVVVGACVGGFVGTSVGPTPPLQLPCPSFT